MILPDRSYRTYETYRYPAGVMGERDLYPTIPLLGCFSVILTFSAASATWV